MMKWESAFRVVAHELRSPAGVIAGYARMLSSGRLDEASRDEAFRQLERAAGRLGDLAQQSSDLAGWLEPREDEEYHLVPINAIVMRGAEAATSCDRVRIVGDPSAVECQVRTREPRALTAALAAVIDSTARELPTKHSEIGVTISRSARPNECDIVVGPPDVIGSIRIDSADAGGKFNLEGGGLGLHLILGAVVLEAHGASLWASSDVRGVTGVRIPVGAGN
jgi:signal transduction histidine kinase